MNPLLCAASFVNRERVEGSRLLNENDIVHFATVEFRRRARRPARPCRPDDSHTMVAPSGFSLSEQFYGSLVGLRQERPELELMIEIHESVVTESRRLVELAARFRDIGVRFAYDHFGAGQARPTS